LFHIDLNKKIQAKLLFMVLKTYIFEMKLSEPQNPKINSMLINDEIPQKERLI